VFQLPFGDNSFDAVICVRMLHLNWSDAERASILSELARVTRRLVIISLYRPTPLHTLWRMVKGTPGRLRFTSDEQFAGLLQQCNLRLASLNPLWHYFHMQTFVVLEKPGRSES
jgi:ubiquinone/menaquinone biosynthesis C-methylase UbiE